jgi:peptide/nickel transport system ATP-binding protein
VVETGLTAEILANPQHDYTRLLLDSVPEMRTDWLDGKGRNRRAHMTENPDRPGSAT